MHKARHPLLLLFLVTAMSFTATSSYGKDKESIKFPRNSYTIAELEAAKAEAKEKGKPIAFVYTDKASDCGLCTGASEMIIKELKSSTVLVYIGDINKAPDSIGDYIYAGGNYMPIVGVYDSNAEKALGIVNYMQIQNNGKKAFKEIKKIIRNYKKQKR